MANLNVRIYNKFDTYENWMGSSLVLGKGEIAIASIPSGDETGLTPPAIGVKVGDGSKTFAQLSWIQAVAGDVQAWAKAADKPEYKASEIKELKEFVEGISDIDTNTEYSFSIADNYKINVQKKDINGEYAEYQVLDLTAAFNAKADKVAGATAGNFAGLDANGNLTDSGKKAADFAEAGHNHDEAYAAKAATEEHIAATDVHVQAGERAKWDGAATQAEANKTAIELLNKTDGTVGSVKKTVDDAITALDLANTYAAKGHNHDDKYDAIGAAAAVQGETTKTVKAVEDEAAAALEAAEAAQGDVDTLEQYVGTFTPVGEETTVVGYVDAKIAAIPAQIDYTVSVAESSPEGYAKAYTFSQKGVDIATINIPKDMVVESGTVVTDPEGQAAGTYLKLVLANAAEDEIFINVTDLIEYVTSGSEAGDQIIVAIDADHKVTATLSEGSVTLAQLNAEVQTAIGKAHEHANKAELDLIASGDKAKWDAAEAKAHEHANAGVLDGITADKVAAWDAAQANVIEEIAGVEGSIAEGTKTFTVTGVSADLLKNGTETLVFDCGTSAV